jgi:hypothetical protein
VAVLAVPVSALVEIALRWLVRAFSGDQPTPWSYFSHELCGTRRWVGGMSAGTRALSTPLIVFLQSAPRQRRSGLVSRTV